MATFEAQVSGLTSLTIDDSSSPTRAELNQFLTDGAKEIISQLPPELLGLCSAQQTFTSVAPGSEAETMNTGKVLSVFRNDGDIDQPCRKISPTKKGRVLDLDDMSYASITDPIYYTENNKINSLPSGGSCKYSEVQYPTVSYTHDAIAIFPDEAEYLVPLYASVRSLQNVLGSKSSNSDITTAFGLLKAAVDQAETAGDKFEQANSESIFGDEDVFDTAASQLTRVKDALNNAEKIIDDGANSPTGNASGDAATYLYTDEDTELLNGAINIARSEIQRAQAHIQEWVAIGDMRVKEINAALSEAKGYAEEVQARLQVDAAQYQWYEKQQAKLQADYDKGVKMLIGATA